MEAKIGKIVVGFDFSIAARRALEGACALAAKNGAEVYCITAVPRGIDRAEVDRILANVKADLTRGEAEAIGLQEIASDVERVIGALDTKDVKITIDVGGKSPAKALLEAADIYEADLIVVGAVGQEGDFIRPVGTDTMRVVRSSMWPVLVARRDTQFPPRRILIGTDLSDASRRALGWALDFGAAFGASVDVLTVCDVDSDVEPTRLAAREFLAAADAPEEVEVMLDVRVGTPHRVLTQVAGEHNYDLVVAGTLGRNAALEFLIGGTSERLLRSLPTSVLLVKPDEFVLRKFKNPV